MGKIKHSADVAGSDLRPGRYLPACLIHQTGTCWVASPRAARRKASFWSSGKSSGLEGNRTIGISVGVPSELNAASNNNNNNNNK